MRKLFLFIIFLCSFLLISCEVIGPVDFGLFSLPVEWATTIQRTADGEQGVFLEQTSDAGYVVLIEYTDEQNPNTQRAVGDNGVKLAKLDSNGDHQWTYNLPDTEDPYDEKGAFVIRNNFSKPEAYLTGVNKIDRYGLSNIKLSYVNNSGSLLWETYLSGSGDDVIYGALVLDQYKTLVYGKTNSYDGSFDNRGLHYDYDGFIFVISNENAEILERYYYDYNREANLIKRVIYNSYAQEYFIIGETNNGNLNKIWLRKIPQLNATTHYDAILKDSDTYNYFFGGIVETGLNSYVIGCEKSGASDNFLDFYGLNTAVINNELIVSYSFQVENYNLAIGRSIEKIIGFTPFYTGNSVLVGIKHGTEENYKNTFLLINQETGALTQQEYKYKEGVLYEHLSGNPYINSYGLTGSVSPDAQGSPVRVAGGHATWVEGF